MLFTGIGLSFIGITIVLLSESLLGKWWLLLPLLISGAILGHYFQRVYRKWALREIIKDMEKQKEQK